MNYLLRTVTCILPAGALQAEQLISILNPEQVANELAKKAKQQKKEKSRTRRRASHDTVQIQRLRLGLLH